jgi:hypothetical protein
LPHALPGFELVMLRDFFFPTTTKADAVEYWKAANRRRANLFAWDLEGFYRIGRRRIRKAKASWEQMSRHWPRLGPLDCRVRFLFSVA